jgi:hypothetical protein
VIGMKFRENVALAVGLLALAGCKGVPDREWQSVCDSSKECSSEERSAFVKEGSCALSDIGREATCNAPYPRNQSRFNFRTAFLEFEETSGTLRDSEQLESVKDFIARQGPTGRPLLISVYVHGWHHNASSSDPNVMKYGGQLARYEYSLKKLGYLDVDVLGIYVGWRGETYSGPLNVLTIGDRANAADVIGQSVEANNGKGLYSTLEAIAELMRASNTNSRMIVMGHSLGGRVVTRALLPAMMNSSGKPLGENVLVTTVNAAIGADAFTAAYQPSVAAETPDWPTWVNITSKDDDATLRRYRQGLEVGFIKPDLPGTDQAKATIGHYAEYLTHELGVASCDLKQGGASATTTCGAVSQLLAGPKTVWSNEDYQFSALSYGVPSTVSKAYSPDFVHCALLTRYPITERTRTALKKSVVCKDLIQDFDLASAPHKLPAHGRMWNIQTDKSVIDFEVPDSKASSTHNGYIQTDLSLLFVQLLYRDAPRRPLITGESASNR